MSIIAKLITKFVGESPQSLVEPEKELRFTRSRQGVIFFLTSTFIYALSGTIFYLSLDQWGIEKPILEGYGWVALFPFCIASFLLRFSLRCIRHAYIILTPMGVEIFPFWKPEKNLQLVYWHEISEAECDERTLTLHFNEERSQGVILSLAPIARHTRPMLQKAIQGRVKSQKDA